MHKYNMNIQEIYLQLRDASNAEILNTLFHISELFHTLSSSEKNDYCINFLLLKICLDTKLARYRIQSNKCCYTQFKIIHTDGNCDLREIFYDINGKLVSDVAKKVIENIQKISSWFVRTHGKIPHILTDIDDTLFPHRSAFHTLFGQDTKGANKKPYPGVIKFMKLFKKQHTKTIKVNKKEIIIPNYITVLSATPNIGKASRFFHPTLREILGSNYSFLQGAETYDKIRQSVQLSTLSVNNNVVGNKKAQRFKEYHTIFPEYQYIFIGDNGQGDVIAGKQMNKFSSDSMVFIHNIQLRDKLKSSLREVQQLSTNRLHFFENYHALGLLLYNLELLEKYNVETMNKTIIKSKGSFSKPTFDSISSIFQTQSRRKNRGNKKTQNRKKTKNKKTRKRKYSLFSHKSQHLVLS